MPLSLQPTHPDLSGGLGILKNGESSFLIIFVAFGAMLSTSLAEEILFGDLTLATSLPIVAIYIALAITIITVPMLFFLWPLYQAKRHGRIVYGSLGYLLSKAFDKKWGDVGDSTRGEELLKTADASSVCDYSGCYSVHAIRAAGIYRGPCYRDSIATLQHPHVTNNVETNILIFVLVRIRVEFYGLALLFPMS